MVVFIGFITAVKMKSVSCYPLYDKLVVGIKQFLAAFFVIKR